jgi:predicted nucleotidyltransferase
MEFKRARSTSDFTDEDYTKIDERANPRADEKQAACSLANDFIDRLKSCGFIKNVFLMGSLQRDTAISASDVDLLVEFRTPQEPGSNWNSEDPVANRTILRDALCKQSVWIQVMMEGDIEVHGDIQKTMYHQVVFDGGKQFTLRLESTCVGVCQGYSRDFRSDNWTKMTTLDLVPALRENREGEVDTFRIARRYGSTGHEQTKPFELGKAMEATNSRWCGFKSFVRVIRLWNQAQKASLKGHFVDVACWKFANLK